MRIKEELKQIISLDGQFVATPIKNAFNNKIAYWLTRKGFTVALYMFTVEDCLNNKDLEARLTTEYPSYQRMFLNQFCKEVVITEKQQYMDRDMVMSEYLRSSNHLTYQEKEELLLWVGEDDLMQVNQDGTITRKGA